ncbi:hypothetical protein BC828DRAFT_207856 [Blastocladiella britannica]|nr:hypothetical protein BC828DRAFT_207856 [Blastocladiella britannica]
MSAPSGPSVPSPRGLLPEPPARKASPSLLGQIHALVVKNLLARTRSPLQLVLVLLAPLLSLILSAAYSSTALGTGRPPAPMLVLDIHNPSALSMRFPDCKPSLDTGQPPVCAGRPTILYAPNDFYHAKVMDTLALDLALTTSQVVAFPSIDALSARMTVTGSNLRTKYPGPLYALAFTSFSRVSGTNGFSTGGIARPSAPPVTNAAEAVRALTASNGTWYTLVPLDTESVDGNLDRYLPNIVYDQSGNLLLKHALDLAIISTRAKLAQVTPPQVDVRFRHFPLPNDARLEDLNAFRGTSMNVLGNPPMPTVGNAFGAAFILLGFCPMLLIFVTQLGTEKHRGLFHVLRRIGTSELAIWIANLVTILLSVLFASLLSLLAVPILPTTSLMANWDPALTLVVVSLGGFQLVSFGMIFVGSLSGEISINMCAGLLTMVSLMASLFIGYVDAGNYAGIAVNYAGIAVNSPSSLQYLFQSPNLGWATSFFPFINFGRLYFELCSLGSKSGRASLSLSSSVLQNTLTFTPAGGQDAGDPWWTPSPAVTMLSAVLFSLLSFVLAAYFNELDMQPLSPFFPLLPSYWGFSAEPDAEVHDQARTDDALVVRNLSVVYDSQFIGVTMSSHDKVAVSDVSFTLRKGRILSLLGVNGAGKSTTINAITGSIRTCGGIISVFGSGRAHNIQRNIGITAQTDVLWPSLTVVEHLQLYAMIRGLPKKEIRAFLRSEIEAIGLVDHADQLVGELSGGKKRILSLALSNVGKPSLIILDEPTASLDPINRQRAWRYISSLKAHAAVILTTHLLDEADALGDEVCIIDAGSVRALDTPMALKKKFGSGYEIGLAGHEATGLADMTAFVLDHAPDATVEERSKHMFVATIPRDKVVVPLLRVLQSRSRDPRRTALVREWEIMSSSLEQVFLRVVSDAKAERDAVTDLQAGELDFIAALYTPQKKPSTLPVVSRSGEVVSVDPFRKCQGGRGRRRFGDEDEDPFAAFIAQPTMGRQVLAVFLKNWSFQRSQRLSTVSLVFVTLCVVIAFFQMVKTNHGSLCPNQPNLSVSLDPSYARSTWNQSEYLQSPRGSDFHTIPSLVRNVSRSPETCDLDVVKNSFLRSLSLCAPGSPMGCFAGDFVLPSQFRYTDNWLVVYSSIFYPEQASFWTTGDLAAADALFTARVPRYDWKKAFAGEFPDGSDLDVGNLQPLTVASVGNDSISNGSSVLLDRIHSAFDHLANKTDVPKKCSLELSTVDPQSYLTADRDPDALRRELLPDYGVDITSFSATKSSLEVLVPPNSLDINRYLAITNSVTCRQLLTSWQGGVGTNSQHFLTRATRMLAADLTWTGHTNVPDWPFLELLHGIANSQFRATMAEKAPFEGIYGVMQTAPEVRPIQILPTAAVFTLPLALSILLVCYLAIPFFEKENRMIEFYQTNGLSITSYWIGNYLFSFTVSLPTLLLLMWITIGTLSTANPLTFMVLALVQVHSGISIGFLLAALIRSPVMAQFMIFVLPPAMTILAAALAVQPRTANAALPLSASLIPAIPFAANLSRLVSLLPIQWLEVAVAFLASSLYILVALGIFAMAGVTDRSSSAYALASDMLGNSGADDDRQSERDVEAADAGVDRKDGEVARERRALEAIAASLATGGRRRRRRGRRGHESPGRSRSPSLADDHTCGSGSQTTAVDGPHLAAAAASVAATTDAEDAASAVAAGPDDPYVAKAINIHKSFGEREVLRRLYLGIKTGTTFGLLGHNGSGKTTLINILTGSSEPSRGKAWIGDEPTTQSRRLAHMIGVVPQFDMVLKELTLAENLRFFARIRGAPTRGPKLEAIVSHCASVVGLADKLSWRAYHLSGGQLRRLQIAVALIGSPQVIFADEPTAGLDPNARLGIWRLLGKIRERGDTAIVLTTHSLTCVLIFLFLYSILGAD